MKAIFLIFLTTPFFLWGFSSKKPGPKVLGEHVKNPAFSKDKNPKEGEAEVSNSFAKTEWEELNKKISAETASAKKNCKEFQLWVAKDDENVRVTAFKSTKLPVKGTFDRSIVSLTLDKKTKKAIGTVYVDLSSYNTGNEDRDRRVIRHIFLAEKQQKALSEATFEVGNFNLSKKPWSADVTFRVKMHDLVHQFTAPTTFQQKGKNLQMTSSSESRLSFAAAGYLYDGFLKLMEACNHESVASFADIGFDVTLKGQCS